jgi:hypothetical protein
MKKILLMEDNGVQKAFNTFATICREYPDIKKSTLMYHFRKHGRYFKNGISIKKMEIIR